MRLMTTGKIGINTIKKWEGLCKKAYRYKNGDYQEKYLTIGYGHYGPDVKEGQTITEEEAEALLRKDLVQFEKEVNSLGKNLRQEQFDALVVWMYNLGVGNFRSSTLRKKLLADADDVEVTEQMIRWVRAGGKVTKGLQKRRVEEANIFLGYELYYFDDKEQAIKKR